ncbi:unnamed protein product [Pieris macdunnoughi]|uniref:Uncharacterized protein n=1 Tax=Pieris macdunnoughi TaxID=345717 RepID=A0A821UJV8_9NEOP|nr:unnamed protein product [Pieris macdunnoughi]
MVIEPIMTYGASIWGHAANKIYNKKLLLKTQRGFALRSTRSFKNVSTNAAVALAGFVPLDLKALESCEIEGARIRGVSRTKPLGLIQSVCTRWNSVFYQLERFVELSEIITPILLKYPKAPTMLTAQQLKFIKDLINILRPLEVITKEISGEDYVTASKIIPIVSCLTGTYNAMKTSTDIGAKSGTLIMDGLKKIFGNI